MHRHHILNKLPERSLQQRLPILPTHPIPHPQDIQQILGPLLLLPPHTLLNLHKQIRAIPQALRRASLPEFAELGFEFVDFGLFGSEALFEETDVDLFAHAGLSG
jgi:hypothetical protein